MRFTRFLKPPGKFSLKTKGIGGKSRTMDCGLKPFSKCSVALHFNVFMHILWSMIFK